MKMLTAITNSERDTEKLGEILGRTLKRGSVIGLCGEIGAGKTCMTRGIARGTGMETGDSIDSPTFVIVSEHMGRIRLCHVDLYRVESYGELYDMGMDETLESGAVCVVEWADRFPAIMPENTVWVDIRVEGKRRRRISISARRKKIRVVMEMAGGVRI